MSAVQPKDTKTSPKELKRFNDRMEARLLAYAAVGAASAAMFAVPSEANAEVVFTPANITFTNGVLHLDINHDGVEDFILVDRSVSGSCCFYTRILSVRGQGSNMVVGGHGSADALHSGSTIGPSKAFQGGHMQMANGFNDSNSFFIVGGHFANTNQRYLGLKFTINGQVHFGWVGFSRVTVTENGSLPVVNATLRGFAYETVPNQPIAAGQRSDRAALIPEVLTGATLESVVQPTLGLLALGWSGTSVWRKERVLG
jgi:hypothetical protein